MPAPQQPWADQQHHPPPLGAFAYYMSNAINVRLCGAALVTIRLAQLACPKTTPK